MKNKISALAFFLAIYAFSNVSAQTAAGADANCKKKCCKDDEGIKIITLNFKTKQITDVPTSLKDGGFYQLNITGINLNLYKISYKAGDSTINSSATFPSFEFPGLDAIAGLIDKLPALASFATKSGTNANLDTMFEMLNNPFDESAIQKSHKPPKPLKKDPMIPIVKDSMAKTKLFVLNQNAELKIQFNSIDELTFAMQQIALNNISDNSSISGSLSVQTVPEVLQQIKDHRKKLVDVYNATLNKQSEYFYFYQKNKLVFEDSALKSEDEGLRALFTQSIAINEKLYAALSADTLFKTLRALVLAGNNESTYTSLPMQLNGDQATLDITIKGKSDDLGLPEYHTSFRFPGLPHWFAGVGGSLYYSNLYSQVYSVTATVRDSAHTDFAIADEYAQHYEIGFATLLHVGYKMGAERSWAINGTIGPAFSISKPIRTRVAAGVGLSFGKKQMISIDYLMMAGYVDRLSNVYSTSDVYSARPETTTISKLQWGGALALGYIYKF